MKDKGTMDRLDEEKKTKFILILKVRLSLELKLQKKEMVTKRAYMEMSQLKSSEMVKAELD